MPSMTLLCGTLLITLGVVGYGMSDPDHRSATALIPSGLGALFVVLGLLARKDNLRKHAMHAAAALGLIGFLAGVGRLIQSAVKETLGFSLASVCISLMAVICAVFVGLCVNSFIQARRRRAQSDTEKV